MENALAARHGCCHGLADNGKNINMTSLNTGIAFEPFEDLPDWNHKYAYRHPK